MAEEDKGGKTSWVITQAEQEVKDAERALRQAETRQKKTEARRILDEARNRLKDLRASDRALREANRGVRQAEKSVAEAEAAVAAAAKTPDPQDDVEAARSLEQAKAREGRRQETQTDAREQRQETRIEAKTAFYEDLGPFAAEIIKEFPQLQQLFQRAVEEGWAPDKFRTEMFSPNRPWSEWISKKGSYWATGFKLQYEISQTPAAWNEKLTEARRVIQAAAKEAGVVLSEEQLTRLSRRYWYSEWQANPATLVSWMQARAKEPGQELETTETGVPLTPAGRQAKLAELADLAESYGLTLTNEVLNTWADKILDPMVNTNKSEDAKFLQYLVGESRSKYGIYADQIDERTSLRQLSGAYVSSLSRILEMNPTDLRLDENTMDPLLKKALTNINPQTGKPERIPLWQFEQMVRQDERWQYTDNARDSYMSAGTRFAQALGLAG